MWKEFAVEPQALADYHHLRYVVEKFGYGKGRLLSRFPKDWQKLVFDEMDRGNMLDIQRMKVVALLQKLKGDGLVSFGRTYESSSSWIDNARREHSRKPFEGMISATPQSGFFAVDEFKDDDLLASLSVRVHATPQRLCEQMRLLLETEQALVFIDNYWRFGERRCQIVLARMFEIARQGKCRRFVFVSRQGEKAESGSFIRHAVERKFSSALEDGFSIESVQIDDSDTPDRIHARYVIGRNAGLRYDKGFGAQPDELVEIGIMDTRLHAQIAELFLEERHPGFNKAVRLTCPERKDPAFRFGGSRA